MLNFLSVGNLKPKLEPFFKLKHKLNFFYCIWSLVLVQLPLPPPQHLHDPPAPVPGSEPGAHLAGAEWLARRAVDRQRRLRVRRRRGRLWPRRGCWRRPRPPLYRQLKFLGRLRVRVAVLIDFLLLNGPSRSRIWPSWSRIGPSRGRASRGPWRWGSRLCG